MIDHGSTPCSPKGQGVNLLPSNRIDRDPSMQALAETSAQSSHTAALINDFSWWCERVRSAPAGFSREESEAMHEALKSVLQLTVVPAEAPRRRSR